MNKLVEDFNNNVPIYLQISNLIMEEIVSGSIKPGEKLPSVRELAVMMKVNPNTVQKSLMTLEDEGLVYTERTNGKYVTENIELIKKSKDKLVIENVKIFLDNMEKLGLNKDEAIESLQKMKGE